VEGSCLPRLQIGELDAACLNSGSAVAHCTWQREEGSSQVEQAVVEVHAQVYLGLIYSLADGHLDLPKAAHWYRQAAVQGNREAQFNLAVLLDRGEGGVPQNLQQAAYWYQQAAAKGDADAQYNLATMYELGEGVSKDLSRAQSWYRQAKIAEVEESGTASEP